MASHSEISQDMIAALAITEPNLDTGVGTVVRKLIDAVAEVVAERDAQAYTSTYAYDLDTRTGADLDEMVALFGFSRLPAIRASGEIVFTRSTPATQAVLIPAGVQVSDAAGVLFATAVTAVLSTGDTAIAIPAMAVEGGQNGNVAAGTLTTLRTGVGGITGVTNLTSFTGGTDEESDASLRARFRATVFRNMAGTEAMFLGLALEDEAVSHANVLGASETHIERVQIVSGEATTTNVGASYVMPETVVFGPSINEGNILREDIHFSATVTIDNQVEIQSLDPTTVPDGLYDIEFRYTSDRSRNIPTQGITNRVDLYVNGSRPVAATASMIFRSGFVFNTTPGDRFNRANFRRPDNSMPVAGNFFIPYPLGPVIDPSVNDSLVIGANTYDEDSDYWLIRDVSVQGGSPRSWFGVELGAVANGATGPDPSNNTVFPVDFVYNEVPQTVEGIIENWRLVTSDVWVHEASPHRLRLNLAIQLLPGYTLTQVQADLTTNVSNYLNSVGFVGGVQASDLLYVVKGTGGVDAARFLTNQDHAVNYGIQQMSAVGSKIRDWTTNVSPYRAIDVRLHAGELPVLHDLYVTVVASNTWGSV